MRYLLRFLHVLEVLVLLPAFPVAFCIFYYLDSQEKADKVAGLWVRKGAWVFSLIIWSIFYIAL